MPYNTEEWDAGKGNAKDHYQRMLKNKKDVIVALVINFAFNTLLLYPLLILGKSLCEDIHWNINEFDPYNLLVLLFQPLKFLTGNVFLMPPLDHLKKKIWLTDMPGLFWYYPICTCCYVSCFKSFSLICIMRSFIHSKIFQSQKVSSAGWISFIITQH